MNLRIRWNRVNQIGYSIEAAMSAITILSLLALILILVMRLEWSMMTDTARAEVLCGEDLAAVATYPAMLSHERDEDRIRGSAECLPVGATVATDTHNGQQLDPVEWVPPLLSAFTFPPEDY